MSNHYHAKCNNFGLSKGLLSDIEDIINPRGRYSIEKDAHQKYVHLIMHMNDVGVKSAKDIMTEIDRLRGILKCRPSKRTLARVYFKDILWPRWMRSSCRTPVPLSKDLMNAFVDYRNIRGSYGTVNITVITEPLQSCRYKCAYCPVPPVHGALKAPRSYLINEPAVARGAKVNYNIVEQIRQRIRDLCVSGVVRRTYDGTSWKTHCKADIRIAGGTFNSYPVEKQDSFIQQVYYAVRTIDYCDEDMPCIMSLDSEIQHHVTNPDLGIQIVGLSIETRPDEINVATINRFNHYRLTWVEIGIQTTHDDVLKKIRRGHKTIDSERAIAMLKSVMGAKVLGHIMPDLPGSSPQKDLEIFEDKVIRTHNFMFNILCCSVLLVIQVPYYLIAFVCFVNYAVISSKQKCKIALPHLFDHIKIYPTMRLPFTEIQHWGIDKWDPYTEKEDGRILTDVICKIVAGLPPWIRIARLVRDFSKASVKNQGLGYVSDTLKTNMAQIVNDRLKRESPVQNEIKSREVGRLEVDLAQITFKLHRYECSTQFPEYAGTEYFGSLEAPADDNVDRLLGLFRLRLNYKSKQALLRELHVYGGYTPKGFNPSRRLVQHRGFGKRLLATAEIISFIKGYKSISVISAPGTVFYYLNQGYHRHGRYMLKKISVRQFMHSLKLAGLSSLWKIIA